MKADTVTKDYVKDAEIFADIFNYYIYDGQPVIRPEQLTERDCAKTVLPYGADGSLIPVQKFRDAQKLYAAKTDGKNEYVLYGVEAQSEVHYAMAVRNNLYDALEYAGQVEEAAKSHRRERKREKERRECRQEANLDSGEKRKTPNAGEFLSGFWKEDRLIPSVTVTIFFGAEEWDGPLSLFDLMDASDPAIMACMDNYHVRLISPARMSDEEIMKFQSSLREVMFFIKYSKDRENLSRILKVDEKRFRELERRAADVIEVITNSGIKCGEGEEAVDVCQAIQEMRMDERRIGELRGEQRGELKGEQNGKLKKAREIAKRLYEMGFDVEKIVQVVGYAEEMVEGWIREG